jgi:hypothetical protein
MLLFIILIIIIAYLLNYYYSDKIVIKKKESFESDNHNFRRICVLGDLHGDKDNARKALIKAELIDNQDNWIGGNSFLIQMGDQIDGLCRKNNCVNKSYSDIKVIDYMEDLEIKAQKNGGKVISLLGNHEIMNLQGDLRFVDQNDILISGGVEKRLELFKHGGLLSKRLSKRPLIYKYKDYIFCHGGLTMSMLENYTIEEMNLKTKNWLLGKKDCPNFLKTDDSPVWSRKFALNGESFESELDQVLKKCNSKMMFVGHTVNSNINSKYNNKFWLTDVGISDKFPGSTIEILEIELKTGKINIIF